MSRALDDLSVPMRARVFELLARTVERGIAVVIVNILRTPAQQAANIANGVSWTTHSKHLPRYLRGYSPASPDSGKSDAIDVCLFETYALHGADKLQWNADEPAWQMLGAIGEGLGLRWGGRWTQRDMGHFEL